MTKRRPSETGSERDAESDVPTQALPAISHLQFLVLDLLNREPNGASATALKEGVAAVCPDYSGPKFYQLMSRLIVAGLVTSESRALRVADSTIERTFYAISIQGASSHRTTSEFYATRQRIAESLSGKTNDKR